MFLNHRRKQVAHIYYTSGVRSPGSLPTILMGNLLPSGGADRLPQLPQRQDLLLDLAAELERGSNGREGFFGAAGAGDDDGAVIENPPRDALDHLDAFDLGQQGFLRPPLNPAHFDNDPLVGDGELGG